MEIVATDSTEGEEIQLEHDSRRTIEIAKHALVGRLISEKAQNMKVTRDMILKSWNYPKGLHIIDLSTNTYLFNFSDCITPLKILEAALWKVSTLPTQVDARVLHP